ncbi:MAG: hypothetical protein AAB229_03275 [Candidatus Hydrogenedentota bacterium]
MKVAVSIPEDLFEEADHLASKSKISRSKLYSNALREYLLRRSPNEITESWNRVVDEVGDEEYEFAKAASYHTLRRVEW